MEVGGLKRGLNHDETIVNIHSFVIITLPHSGEGCGDTLKRTTVLEKKFERS
jgi:hypothetical protein